MTFRLWVRNGGFGHSAYAPHSQRHSTTTRWAGSRRRSYLICEALRHDFRRAASASTDNHRTV